MVLVAVTLLSEIVTLWSLDVPGLTLKEDLPDMSVKLRLPEPSVVITSPLEPSEEGKRYSVALEIINAWLASAPNATAEVLDDEDMKESLHCEAWVTNLPMKLCEPEACALIGQLGSAELPILIPPLPVVW